MGVIHVFSHPASHSTARYFERAIAASGPGELSIWSGPPHLASIRPDDVFVFIDPAPDWPIGVETLPCLTLAYLIDVHQDLRIRLDLSRFFDAVFVAQKDAVQAFRDIGHPRAFWAPLACDPAVHHAPAKVRDIDVGFVGKLGMAGTSRYRILTTVLPRYNVNDYWRFYQPEEMAVIYGRSKIVFNASINGDVNMRVYEAWASGALLVTDRIRNGFEEIFKENENCVCYSSIEEAIEKIDYYLSHDGQRESIAAEGWRLASNFHTYSLRWEEMLRLSETAYGAAPARTCSTSELRELYTEIFVSLRLPWRIPAAMFRYGTGASAFLKLALALGRWLNARAPITPNALRMRLWAKGGRA